MSSTTTTTAAPAANLEIAEALLLPGPGAGVRLLQHATVRRVSPTNPVGSAAAAWKGAEDRKKPGPNSSFFQGLCPPAEVQMDIEPISPMYAHDAKADIEYNEEQADEGKEVDALSEMCGVMTVADHGDGL